MTVAARAMRRVLRRKRNIIWAIFGWSVFFINALLLIPFDGEPFTLDAITVISLLVEVMLLSVLLFQDRFNGMIARKNALAGTKEYHVAFGEDSLHSSQVSRGAKWSSISPINLPFIPNVPRSAYRFKWGATKV